MNPFLVTAILLSVTLVLLLWIFGLFYTTDYVERKLSCSVEKAIVLGVPAYLVATIIVLLLLGVVL